MVRPTPRRALPGVWIAVFVVCLGATWPAQQVGLRYWPPLLMVAVRTFVAGAVLMVIGRIRRAPRPAGTPRPALTVVAWAALYNVVLLSIGAVYAVQLLSGGVASLLVYTQPVLLVLVAHRFLGEPVNGRQFGAVLLGLSGVALITVHVSEVHGSFWGIAAGLGAAAAWTAGTVYLRIVDRRRGSGRPVRRRPADGPAGLPALAAQSGERNRLVTSLAGPMFALGGLVLLALGSTLESWRAIDWSPRGLLAVALFTLFGTLGWYAYLSLLEHRLAARRLAAWSFGVPLVANVAGVTLLGQQLYLLGLAGGVAVLVGIVAIERWAPDGDAATLA